MLVVTIGFSNFAFSDLIPVPDTGEYAESEYWDLQGNPYYNPSEYNQQPAPAPRRQQGFAAPGSSGGPVGPSGSPLPNYYNKRSDTQLGYPPKTPKEMQVQAARDEIGRLDELIGNMRNQLEASHGMIKIHRARELQDLESQRENAKTELANLRGEARQEARQAQGTRISGKPFSVFPHPTEDFGDFYFVPYEISGIETSGAELTIGKTYQVFQGSREMYVSYSAVLGQEVSLGKNVSEKKRRFKSFHAIIKEVEISEPDQLYLDGKTLELIGQELDRYPFSKKKSKIDPNYKTIHNGNEVAFGEPITILVTKFYRKDPHDLTLYSKTYEFEWQDKVYNALTDSGVFPEGAVVKTRDKVARVVAAPNSSNIKRNNRAKTKN